MTTHGIDGASVAGLPNCMQLAAEGFQFGFPRMSFGHVRDPVIEEYLRRLREAEMLARPYAYFRSWENPTSQARFVRDLSGKLAQPFVWLDVEPAKAQLDDGSWPIPSDAPARTAEGVSAWCDQALTDGLSFGLYGGPWYFDLLFAAGLPPWVFELPLWLSHYGVDKPRVPAGWSRVHVWQRVANTKRAGAVIDENETPLTIEQLDALLGGERDTPIDPDPNLALAMAWSDAARGIKGSVERFVDRDEGPRIDR